MSNMEDRLRDAFRADAQTIPPHAMRPFASPTAWRPDRERPVRERRALVPLAAAAALALIVGGAVVAPRLWQRSDDNHPAPTGLAAAFPGGRVPTAKRPAYLVAVVPKGGDFFNTRLEVISTKTGRVTSTIAPPKPGQTFTAVAARNGSFIAEVTSRRVCETWFYGFGVNQAGQPSTLESALGSPAPGYPAEGYDTRAGALAVTPDERVVAYVLGNCRGSGGVVGVFRPASQHATLWRYHSPARPESVSLTADGKLLELVSNPSDAHAGVANSRHNAVWALRTAGRGGQLKGGYRRAVQPTGRIMSAALSPTGTLTFVASQDNQSLASAEILAYRTSTGKPLFHVGVFTAGGFDIGPSIGLDPTGRYLLISDWQDSTHPSRQHPVQGIDLVDGTIFTIPGTAADQAISTAW